MMVLLKSFYNSLVSLFTLPSSEVIKFAMAEKARNPSILLILVALFLLSSGGFELGAAAARVVSGCNAELQHFKEMLGAQKPLLLEERMGKATATKDLTSLKRGGDVPSPGVGH